MANRSKQLTTGHLVKVGGSWEDASKFCGGICTTILLPGSLGYRLQRASVPPCRGLEDPVVLFIGFGFYQYYKLVYL